MPSTPPDKTKSKTGISDDARTVTGASTSISISVATSGSTSTDPRQPLTPESADKVLDILAPVTDEPLALPDQSPLPPVTALVTLHRTEVEATFVEPPMIGVGEEPEIPARFAGGLSVLPHVDFPA